VTTRVIAAVLMTPLLTLFAMLVGTLGGAFTMLSYGVPFVTFVKEVDGIVNFGISWQAGSSRSCSPLPSPASDAFGACRPPPAPPPWAIRRRVRRIGARADRDHRRVFAVVYFFLDI
jgi:hypothetical protein